jgi:hypothetical protein
MAKCPNCKADFITAQVEMNFHSMKGGTGWREAQVIADVCSQCGKMDFHLATPQQFAGWLNSQK